MPDEDALNQPSQIFESHRFRHGGTRFAERYRSNSVTRSRSQASQVADKWRMRGCCRYSFSRVTVTSIL
jgi:hypothetical protein